MGSQSLSASWISNDNTDINKQQKTCTDLLPLKTITHYHKHEWQNKHDSTIAGLENNTINMTVQ
jgi:hypothetical protein